MLSFRLFYSIAIFYLFTQTALANTFSLTNNGDDTWHVNYFSDAIIAGFQFHVDGATVNSVSGGDAEAAGFLLSTGNNTVLGFSLTGSSIPPGEGILLIMELSGTSTGLSGIIVSDPSGTAIDFTYDDGGGCTDDIACNYDLNATQDDGSCEYAEENYDCNGICIAELDECDICGGDGSSCAVNMVDVLYNSDTDIAGFQFYVENVVLISATGGDAESFGFMVSTGNNIVLGFSLTGAVIPSGNGVLITLEVEGTSACINDLILSDVSGIGLDATIDDCLNIQYTTPIPGCTDEIACNYNSDAEVDDDSCEYPENNYDCDGNCIAELDCMDECGGSAVFDECGVCNGTGIPDGECNCEGNVEDCAGVCNGNAVLDECGECDGDGTSCLFVTLYFGELTDNNIEIWLDNPLNVAGFQFMLSGLSISGVSGGSAEENGFMISNSATTVVGFSLSGAVIPVGNTLLMNLSFDAITGEAICLSNAVIADQNGNGIDYEVGSCLDPSNYFNGGCSDDSACNYMGNTDYDDGTCVFAQENFDCDGNCLLEYDCAGVCGGNSIVDECGICEGSGPVENYDCEGNCIVDIDCNDVCGGGAVYDNCGYCGGDGTSCENPEATLSFGDLGGDIMLEISYTDPIGDICIENPILSDPSGIAVGVIVGECVVLTEMPGVLEMYLNSSIDIAGFQFNLTGLTITGASGGNAEASGFMISNSASTVVGFSLTGSTMNANGSVGCMDDSSCNYNGEATISSGCSYEVDCAGVCGGSSVDDECGICNGPGADIECWDEELVCNVTECSDEPIYENVDYATEIQPIFNANCTYYCHTNGGAYQGGLDLTTYDNLMSGNSDHDPVVIPGDSENSILIQKLSAEPPFGDQMPQNGPPFLDPTSIAHIAAWIDEGALPSEDDNEVANSLSINVTIDHHNGLDNIDVFYVSQEDIAGFQFDVEGATIFSASGGAAEENGFMMSNSETTVVGFSLTGSIIPAGSGLLLELTADVTGGVTLYNIIVADINGADLGFEFADGTEETISGCTDPNAENYNPDATDDDGSCTYPPLGELTFGIIDYENGTLEINLDCQYAVSSFVFELFGINITGYYGGTTEASGFDIIIDGATVSGNTTGDNIPANSGLLMIITFDAITADGICFESSTITTFVGIEYEAILDDCIAVCNEDEFNCGDGNCIPGSWECDGTNDCSDAGDEDDCDFGTDGGGDDGAGACEEGYVDDCSGDGDCCPESWIGDGFADCEDQAYGCDLTCYDNDEGDCSDGGTDGGGEDSIELSIELNQGSNLISFSVLPVYNYVGNVLSSLGDNVVGLSGEGEAAMNTEDGWVGSLTTIFYENGYWLLVNETATLQLTGIIIQPDHLYALHTGSNLISYPLSECGNIDEVLPDEMEACIYAIAGEGIATLNTDVGWVGSLTSLCPNEGYWFVNQCDEIEFTFDEPVSLARIVSLKVSPYPYHQSSQQAFYFIQSIANIEVGDWILAYNGNKVIGARQWTGAPIDIPTMGYDGTDFTRGFMEVGATPQFKLFKKGEIIALEGEVPAWSNNKFYMVSSLSEIQPISEIFSLDRAYPNPFNPTTALNFTISIDSEVSLIVYNMQGRMVEVLVSGNMQSGQYSVIWNAYSYSSGMYFVKMIAGDFVSHQKLMLVK